MKINTLSTSICLLGLLLTSSCSESFIDLTPPTAIRQDAYFKTQSDITAALNGTYGGLRSYYDTFFYMAELTSDNAEANARTEGAVGVFDRYSWVVTDGAVGTRWTRAYANIARSNTLLERSATVPMDEALKVRYQAEAKFLRALMYFDLVRFFGDVPLVLTEIKTEEQAYTFARTPLNEVYAQIEKDLTEAAAALPVQYTGADIGRATKGAAQGLLGKVYVTRRQFDKAAPVLKSVIDAKTYSLLPVYEDVFRANNGNNAEIVFAVQYLNSNTREGSNFSLQFAPTGAGADIVTGGSPQANNQGTLDLFNAFEAGDKRKSASIQQFTGGDRPYYTRKFLDTPPTDYESNNDWPVLRYADLLLLYAEVLNELGTTPLAETVLNQVRSRAGLTAKTGLTQVAFRLAVEQERRVELCFEGHRWFDLLRTDRAIPVITAYVEKYRTTGGYLVRNYQLKPTSVLFPIPFREISLNPNLTQNPGY